MPGHRARAAQSYRNHLAIARTRLASMTCDLTLCAEIKITPASDHGRDSRDPQDRQIRRRMAPAAYARAVSCYAQAWDRACIHGALLERKGHRGVRVCLL